ncbi:hypothetical protein DVS28_a1529 [Euzebya pacifica]|uniref:Uncharacterized protein n=1 Tax=Euzebya pacifica TaxID=1608957 RepID=A0A346XVH5_9ACTN|nr:hypothetical protein [Euzebya pacifica]AXV06222.1 hypothetical protein DVS28_a1529 [Euzebya pacifica]
MTTSTGPPEVSFGHDAGRLAIVIRWFHPSQWFWYPRVLLLLALDLLLVVGVRYTLVVAESWALLVPLGMFVALPAAALHVDVVRSLRNRTTITVDETRLRAITGPMAPAGADVPLAGVAGWRITDVRSRSDLLAVGADGTAHLLGRLLTPEAARAAAQRLEESTGIGMVEPAPPVAPRPVARMLLSVVLVLAVAGWAGWRLAGPALPGLLAELDVLAGPSTTTVTPAEATTATVWLRGTIRLDRAVNPERFFLEQLAGEYALLLEGDVSVSCDPTDVAFFVDQQTVSGGSSSTIAWYGRLTDCAVRLPAGTSTVTARLRAPDGPDPVDFLRAEVLLRQ